MKGLRGDLLSVAAVLSVPLGLAAVFPREAIGFSASDVVGRAREQEMSIVFLDSDAVSRAVQATRILSRKEGGGAGAELLVAELPGPGAVPAMPIEFRSRPKAPAVVEGGVPPFLPSRRAAAPIRISGGKDADALPFPRNELLKLN